jgi:hypothetical protein
MIGITFPVCDLSLTTWGNTSHVSLCYESDPDDPCSGPLLIKELM